MARPPLWYTIAAFYCRSLPKSLWKSTSQRGRMKSYMMKMALPMASMSRAMGVLMASGASTRMTRASTATTTMLKYSSLQGHCSDRGRRLN